MSLEYEAWCPEEPKLAPVTRVASLVMRAALAVDQIEVVPSQPGELWRFDWGGAAFAQVSVMGPQYAEIPGWWTLWAEQGERGGKLHALLSLVIVASAAVVYGGIVVDETGRLRERKNDPFDVILSLLRSGKRGHEDLLRILVRDA